MTLTPTGYKCNRRAEFPLMRLHRSVMSQLIEFTDHARPTFQGYRNMLSPACNQGDT